jgi:hypothetical protein
MKSKPKSPIWPYLGILACLFVLSITAPRAWDRMAREQSLQRMLSARKSAPPVQKALRIHREPASREAEFSREVVQSTIGPAADPSAESFVVSDALLGPRGEATSSEGRDLATYVVSPPFEYAASPASVAEDPEALARTPSPVAVSSDDAVSPEPATAEPGPTETVTTETVPIEEGPIEAGPVEPVEPVQPKTTLRWPLPRALVSQWHRLAELDAKATWTVDAERLVERLCGQPERDPATAEILGALRAMERRAESQGGKVDRAIEIERARARYGLARWLELWQSAADWEQAGVTVSPAARSNGRIMASLAETESLMRKGTAAAAWQKYLQLDRLRALANASSEETIAERRKVAQTVLDRLAPGRLTAAQRKFVAKEPLATLVEELRPWAAEAVPAARVLADVEQYEYTNLASDAERLAQDWHGLANAAPSEAVAVGRSVDATYRNANMRLAVTRELLNRLVPQPKAIKGQVHDTVLDVPVHGCSTTFTKLSVRLVPDDRVIRLKIEGDGRVSSDTVATSGPASFRSQGQSSFQVQKPVVIGPQGMTVWPAEARAENDYSQLVAMETQFDGVPLFGSLVRSIARTRHDESQDDALAEVGQKVALRAREQFDAEVKPHLASAAEKIQTRQAAAIERLGLEVVPLAMSSTEERMVARVRLGAPGQLGGHTPRPQAPSNSWFSLQIHQSALNNVFEKLDLDGRSFTLAELFAWIGDKLDRSEWASREELPEGVRMKFATKDAVRVRAESGRLMVTFSFAELAQGGKRWRDFAVRTYYKPEADGLDARFTRDPNDTIHLEGKSVKGIQVALRTIFSKVLSRNRDLHLVGETFVKDERLQDLEVSQYVVEDGWIGLAYGPKRPMGNVARKPGSAKK